MLRVEEPLAYPLNEAKHGGSGCMRGTGVRGGRGRTVADGGEGLGVHLGMGMDGGGFGTNFRGAETRWHAERESWILKSRFKPHEVDLLAFDGSQWCSPWQSNETLHPENVD